jgi:hypothetical protein
MDSSGAPLAVATFMRTDQRHGELVRTARSTAELREKVGEVIGRSWAPAVATISRVRRARMFHPAGHTFAGRAESTATGELEELGRNLAGRVLARCSGALWKHPVERFEVLGIALRFRHGDRELDAAAETGDQDLLLATTISPWLLPLSPLTTNARDFLANTYHGASPFELASGIRVKLRLRPLVAGPREDVGRGVSRDELLRRAVASGRAAFALEARRTLSRTWRPVARIVLERELDIDQDALRFDPFRIGAGLAPVGLVHAIRRAVYPASQWGRPGRSAIPATGPLDQRSAG